MPPSRSLTWHRLLLLLACCTRNCSVCVRSASASTFAVASTSTKWTTPSTTIVPFSSVARVLIWSLSRYHKSHVWNIGTRPRMEALVQDVQQFAAKVRWKWHFRAEPRGFYIHLKNSRYTPPCPHATPPELEGWLSLLRERMLMTARATVHNPRLQQSRSHVLPLTKHGWKCLKTICWVAFFERQRWRFHFGA